MGIMQLAAGVSHGETVAFVAIGVLGLLVGGSVYLFPAFFDAVTRLRLRMQGQPEDDALTLERDRSRRRFIALILAVGSAAVLAQGLSRL
ncbi:MAG: hypothetical protein QOC95_124 [Thermoleophilaceae bacterium]|jgi:hypothetical protein|nr:hypothetical protein [Thermoleophilaceae bacterium]